MPETGSSLKGFYRFQAAWDRQPEAAKRCAVQHPTLPAAEYGTTHKRQPENLLGCLFWLFRLLGTGSLKL